MIYWRQIVISQRSQCYNPNVARVGFQITFVLDFKPHGVGEKSYDDVSS